jgi:hypothetical protein
MDSVFHDPCLSAKSAVEANKILNHEIGYFDRHKDRMDYKQGKALGQPIGSGAMESSAVLQATA